MHFRGGDRSRRAVLRRAPPSRDKAGAAGSANAVGRRIRRRDAGRHLGAEVGRRLKGLSAVKGPSGVVDQTSLRSLFPDVVSRTPDTAKPDAPTAPPAVVPSGTASSSPDVATPPIQPAMNSWTDDTARGEPEGDGSGVAKVFGLTRSWLSRRGQEERSPPGGHDHVDVDAESFKLYCGIGTFLNEGAGKLPAGLERNRSRCLTFATARPRRDRSARRGVESPKKGQWRLSTFS